MRPAPAEPSTQPNSRELKAKPRLRSLPQGSIPLEIGQHHDDCDVKAKQQAAKRGNCTRR